MTLYNNEEKPGEQCLIDCAVLPIKGEQTNLNLMIFVLPFSRLIYVSVSDMKFNPEAVIKSHDEAFSYFSGVPHKCVYSDSSTFTDLDINGPFHHYANKADFSNYAHEVLSYEDKGIVERELNFVGRSIHLNWSFDNMDDLKKLIVSWLDKVANQRTHPATKKTRQVYYEQDEKQHMIPYSSSFCMEADFLESSNL